MAYTKTLWANGISPALNNANLNKMEQGIYDNDAAIEAHKSTSDVHNATPDVAGNKIIIRDTYGRAKVGAPAEAGDIARKAEVDAATALMGATVGSHSSSYAVHGATSTASGGRMILRDASGRAKVVSPSESDDIARKDTIFGVSNSSVEFAYLLQLPIDTRNYNVTTWDAANNPLHINIRSGITAVATIDLEWNSDNKLTKAIVKNSPATKIITYTFSWTGMRFNGYTKAVI